MCDMPLVPFYTAELLNTVQFLDNIIDAIHSLWTEEGHITYEETPYGTYLRIRPPLKGEERVHIKLTLD